MATKVRRTQLFITAACLVVLLPTRGSGHGQENIPYIYLLELGIPDSRYEYCHGCEKTSDWVLSAPIYLDVERWELSKSVTLINMPMLEPQYAVFKRMVRGLLGTRLVCGVGGQQDSRPVFGFFIEGAGLLGRDGHGGVVGAGISYFIYPSLPISLTYRRTWTTEEDRHDVSIGVEVQIPIFRVLFQ